MSESKGSDFGSLKSVLHSYGGFEGHKNGHSKGCPKVHIKNVELGKERSGLLRMSENFGTKFLKGSKALDFGKEAQNVRVLPAGN